MSDIAKADLSVRVVETIADADQSVFVVNQEVVQGTKQTGAVPTAQADGSLAWTGPYATLQEGVAPSRPFPSSRRRKVVTTNPNGSSWVFAGTTDAASA